MAYLHSHLRENSLISSEHPAVVQRYLPSLLFMTSRSGLGMGFIREGTGEPLDPVRDLGMEGGVGKASSGVGGPRKGIEGGGEEGSRRVGSSLYASRSCMSCSGEKRPLWRAPGPRLEVVVEAGGLFW